LRLREYFRARGARGGDRHAQTGQAEGVLDEVAQRMRGMNDRPTQIRRVAAIGLEPYIGFFACADAGGRRAYDDCNSIGPITLARRKHLIDEAVRDEAAPSQPIIATVPL